MTHAWCPGKTTGRIHHRRINPHGPSPLPPLGPWLQPRYASIVALTALSLHLAGCASYQSIVKPVPQLSVLSPELENLTDVAVETYLTADVRPVFPSVLAVAKVRLPHNPYYRGPAREPSLEVLRGDEADGWRRLIGPVAGDGQALLDQVQMISPLIAESPLDLKTLRTSAALLHAPLLLVYLQDDGHSQGYNDAAMAYWTIIGLFVVPGHTVGHYTTCQGVLVDTRSGFILATAQGEGLREEHVLPGAVNIARDRVRREAQSEAIAALQKDLRATLASLAHSRGVRAE
ncbi:MAG: hypothetical protein IID40_01540 [Planctomycetes bacterium]|nr:hypothetical protein [Planctomycetota bacterium]